MHVKQVECTQIGNRTIAKAMCYMHMQTYLHTMKLRYAWYLRGLAYAPGSLPPCWERSGWPKVSPCRVAPTKTADSVKHIIRISCKKMIFMCLRIVTWEVDTQ